MGNVTKFDGKGEIYAKARPGYADAAFDFIKSVLPDASVFADVGSGTGIFSELLLAHGYRVYAVEPNPDMRMMAEEKLGGREGFVSVNGTDAATGLPDASVDAVTVAQAFHWFDVERFKAECRRILKPGGKVVIIYNTRDERADCNRALAELHRRYCPEFKGFSRGMNEEKCRAFFGGACEEFRADNSRVYDKQGYVDRALSSSYSLTEADENYAEYLAETEKLFDAFAEDGALRVPMDTVLYVGDI